MNELKGDVTVSEIMARAWDGAARQCDAIASRFLQLADETDDSGAAKRWTARAEGAEACAKAIREQS